MQNMRNQGSVLIQSLALIAVGTIVVGVVTSKSAIVAKAAKRTESRADVLGLKDYLFQNVDCSSTLSPLGPKGNPCSGGSLGYIELRGKTGVLLATDTSTRFGKWNALAYCNSTGIEIRAVSLLPAHYGNLADLQWVGKSIPENVDHYRQDELTKVAYSWNHAGSVISKPDSHGLCSDWFGTVTTPGTCNGYVRSIDLKNKTVTCEDVPSCNYPDNLVFDEATKKYACKADLMYTSYYKNLENTNVKLTETVNYFNHILATNIMPTVYYTNGRISAFPNMGVSFDIMQNSFSECATRDLMKCPEGTVMWGYEALMESAGDHCRVRCVQLKPY